MTSINIVLCLHDGGRANKFRSVIEPNSLTDNLTSRPSSYDGQIPEFLDHSWSEPKGKARVFVHLSDKYYDSL